jgi:hypothetical protein
LNIEVRHCNLKVLEYPSQGGDLEYVAFSGLMKIPVILPTALNLHKCHKEWQLALEVIGTQSKSDVVKFERNELLIDFYEADIEMTLTLQISMQVASYIPPHVITYTLHLIQPPDSLRSASSAPYMIKH